MRVSHQHAFGRALLRQFLIELERPQDPRVTLRLRQAFGELTLHEGHAIGG